MRTFTTLSVLGLAVALFQAGPTTAFRTCEARPNKLVELGVYGPHKADLPFSISLPENIATYEPNTPIPVTISGIASYTEITLYAADNQYSPQHVGTWVDLPDQFSLSNGADPDNEKFAGCAKWGKDATLVSKDAGVKSLPATFMWQPPSEPTSGSVKFYGIVVAGDQQGFKFVTTEKSMLAMNPYPAKQANSASTSKAALFTLTAIAGALVTYLI
ncbi:hypothetical protein DFS34DRAFT_651476 [Phlyctochytrium arcticum]|nr:hypothetical protein DFS34DRAFT_651476 [Phlyctochytrium arcticum]